LQHLLNNTVLKNQNHEVVQITPGSTVIFNILMAQKEISDPNAETRSIKGFHAIKVSTGIQLILTQSTTEAVAVSATTTEHRDKNSC
jgi:hypothetical protein